MPYIFQCYLNDYGKGESNPNQICVDSALALSTFPDLLTFQARLKRRVFFTKSLAHPKYQSHSNAVSKFKLHFRSPVYRWMELSMLILFSHPL